MEYSMDKLRLNCFAQPYIEVAIENYLMAQSVLNHIKKEGEKWPQFSEYEMIKRTSTVVVFSAMAIESFLNDYAATCLNDENYYDIYDSLSIINKFQLVVQFVLGEKTDKTREPYGLLKKLTKNRNNLVHNKSKEAKDDDYLYSIEDGFREAKDAIRAVVQLVNFFDARERKTSACERMFAGYTLCYFENEPESEELKELIKLGLDVSRQKPYRP